MIQENKKIVKNLWCLICGEVSDPHHIKSRGSGGSDDLINLVPLCNRHHSELHQIGQELFYKKYRLNTDFITKLIKKLT